MFFFMLFICHPEYCFSQIRTRQAKPRNQADLTQERHVFDSAYTEVLSFLLKDPCNPNTAFIEKKSADLQVLARKAGRIDVGLDFELNRDRQRACDIKTSGPLSDFHALIAAIIDNDIAPCEYRATNDYRQIFDNKKKQLGHKNYDMQMPVNVRNYIWKKGGTGRSDRTSAQTRYNDDGVRMVTPNGECLLKIAESVLTGSVRPE